MKKRNWLKMLTALFIIVALLVYFNWNTVSSGAGQFNIYTLALVMLVLLGIPAAILAGDWLDSWAKSKRMGMFTSTGKLGKVKKPEEREAAARQELNKHRGTDSYLAARNMQDMEIVMRATSPFRQDAVQLEMFAFTTADQKPNWNPLLDDDGVPAEYVFYVMVNCHTCETFFNRYRNSKEATTDMMKIWSLGVKKIETSETEKLIAEGALREIGAGAVRHKEETKDEGEKE